MIRLETALMEGWRMNDLYFLGDNISKINIRLATACTEEERMALTTELKEAQMECPHWDSWKEPNPAKSDGDICGFCFKNWSEVIDEKMRAAQEFRQRARETLTNYQKAVCSIEALKESCTHPKGSIVNEPTKTYCGECDETFWPPRRLYGNGGIVLDLEDLINIKAALARFQSEKDRLDGEITRIQARCPHPENEKEFDQGDYDCGICALSWSEVLKRQVAMRRPVGV